MPEPLINTDTPAAPPPNPGASAPAVPGAGVSDQPNPQAVTRPEFLPEDLWDAEKNAPKHEEIIKGYGELSKFKADADAKAASVPEKADDYKMPESLVDDEVAKIIPAGHEITVDEKSPLLVGFREFAHKQKLSQEQFAEGVQLYLKQQVLEEKAFADAREAELKKLGGTGKQRQDAVATFLKSIVGDADAQVLLSGVFSAKQFEAWERVQARFSNNGNVVPFTQQRDNQPPPEKTYEPGERIFTSMRG